MKTENRNRKSEIETAATRNSPQPDPELEIQEPDGLWLGLLIWLHIAGSWLRDKLHF